MSENKHPSEPVSAGPGVAYEHCEQRIDRVVEEDIEVTVLHDEAGIVTAASLAITPLLGYTPDEVVGSSLFMLVHPADKETMQYILGEILHTPGKSLRADYRLRHKDGSYHWFAGNEVNLLEVKGVEAVVGNFRERSEDHRKEEVQQQLLAREQAALKEAEVARQRLSDLFLQAPAAVAIMRGPEHRLELINAPFRQIYGNRDFRIGGTARENWPELESTGLFEVLDWVYATGETFQAQEFYSQIDRNKDGVLSDIYFTFIYQPTRDVHGIVDGIQVHGFEVTDQVLARERIEESEAQWQLLAESLPQKVFTTRPNGEMDYANQRWIQFTGLPFNQLKTWGWTRLIHPDDVEEALRRWHQSVETGNSFTFEARVRRYDGVYRWHLSRAIPMRDMQGTITMWIGSNTDIDEQKELENRKDAFINMTSHELKTPVTSLQGFMYLLRRHLPREANAQTHIFLDKMDAQLTRLMRIVRELLDLSRMQNGTLPYSTEYINLDVLIKEVVEQFQMMTTTHEVRLIGQTRTSISGDRDRLEQVFLNLLANAIKYSPPGTRVTVTLMQRGDEACISVQDQGIGIAPIHHDHLFERFYQVSDPVAKTFPGLGIGLYLSSQIVHHHQGRLWVESEPGGGATFFVSLPGHLEPNS